MATRPMPEIQSAALEAKASARWMPSKVPFIGMGLGSEEDRAARPRTCRGGPAGFGRLQRGAHCTAWMRDTRSFIFGSVTKLS